MTSKEFETWLETVEITNGWAPLPAFGTKITRRSFFSIGNGWLSLAKDVLEAMLNAGWNGSLVQVKEKFGNMVINIGQGNTSITEWALMEYANNQSRHICEFCGERGVTRHENSKGVRKGWIGTLCDKHQDMEGIDMKYGDADK